MTTKTILIFLAVVLLLAGCSGGIQDKTNEPETPQVNWIKLNFDLFRAHDNELNVTCWSTRSSGGLHCIPDWQLVAPELKP